MPKAGERRPKSGNALFASLYQVSMMGTASVQGLTLGTGVVSPLRVGSGNSQRKCQMAAFLKRRRTAPRRDGIVL
ncbi:hypothetical protein EKH55_5281 [Sinorhizobium alkalisoli]|nr:hypothetical protein EKH55_5281 [Sinorhizobium alkalisoli]